MTDNPLRLQIVTLLTRLEAIWEDFPDEELGDTLSRGILFDALKRGFLATETDFVLTTAFSMQNSAADKAIYAALGEFLPAARAAADKAGLTTPQQRIAVFFSDVRGKGGSEVDNFFGWMEPEDWLLGRLRKLLYSHEQDPLKLSKLLLNATAKEYSTQRKEKFANLEFIETVMQFNEAYQSGIITRNCLLAIGHVCRMYKFYPDLAFYYLWQYRSDKKQILFMARQIEQFPQFLKQPDYPDFLIGLSKATPKKEAVSLLHTVMMIAKPKLSDKETQAIIKTFENYISKYPQNYESQNHYLKLVNDLKAVTP